MTTIIPDWENDADTWWDAARAEANARPYAVGVAVFRQLDKGLQATVDDEHAITFLRWAAALPGWGDGPSWALHPVLIQHGLTNEKEEESWHTQPKDGSSRRSY